MTEHITQDEINMIEIALEGEGKVGVIVPHGVLFRGGYEGIIRRGLPIQRDCRIVDTTFKLDSLYRTHSFKRIFATRVLH